MARILHLPRPGSDNMARRPEITVAELLQLVEDDYRDNGKRSKRIIELQIDKHLNPFFGKRSAERVTAADIEAYKQMRLAIPTRFNPKTQRSTINLELATLRRGYNLGKQRGLVSKVPVIALYRIGNSNRRTGFFEREDFIKMLGACLPYQKQILRFAYICGMREGEIFDLQWDENYDPDANVIRIYTSKSGKGRVIPLMFDMAKVIEEQKDHRVAGCPYIFHYYGRKCNRNTFNRHWRKACEVAGVNRLFHDLRRTAVRNLMRSGVHRTIAKQITGHETDEIFERYDIVDVKDLKEAFTRVNTYVGDSIQALCHTVESGTAYIPDEIKNDANPNGAEDEGVAPTGSDSIWHLARGSNGAEVQAISTKKVRENDRLANALAILKAAKAKLSRLLRRGE